MSVLIIAFDTEVPKGYSNLFGYISTFIGSLYELVPYKLYFIDTDIPPYELYKEFSKHLKPKESVHIFTLAQGDSWETRNRDSVAAWLQGRIGK